jgi:thiamine-phosphate diphosphorylase
MQADGVHLGQTDMPITLARKLLPNDAIIGVSVNSLEQARIVKEEGLADYVGIGSIWPTSSKNVTTPILGPRGVGPILDELDGTTIKAVAIGWVFSIHLYSAVLQIFRWNLICERAEDSPWSSGSAKLEIFERIGCDFGYCCI